MGYYRAKKVDANQLAIVKALEAAGCGVADLSACGGGIPDLLVHPPGYPECRLMALMEIKNKKGRGDKLTPAQEKFHARWKGPIFRVTSPEEALQAMGVL
jgi:hypothetical protein